MSKLVRDNLDRMELNPTQLKEINKAGGMDRELCDVDGCYKLSMVKGYRKDGTPRFSKVCSKHNNAESHLKEMNHRKHLLKLTHVDCDDCGMNLEVKNVEVHHVNGNHYDNRRVNLKNLCDGCHKVYTIGEKQFESYEKRFGMTKAEMKTKMKALGYYYGKG